MENPKGVSYFIKKELPQLNFALIFLCLLEEEEEEEEAFFSFLRAHFYCLKYPRLHLNASARAS